MTSSKLLELIRSNQGAFSASQRLVAEYVVENYLKIPFLTINAMADDIGVSSSTIIKFCNQLGFSKFAEFKNECSDFLHSELVIYNKLSESSSADEPKDSFFTQEIEESTAAIYATLSDEVNQKNLPKLLSMIERAKSIYITGGRSSANMAALFADMLRYLGFKVHEISPNVGSYLDHISMIDADDLVIAIAFPRYTSQVVEAVKQLHQEGVPVALITDNGLSPAYNHADVVFHCSVASGYYFPSLSGCMAMMNVICRAASSLRPNQASDHAKKLETALLNSGTFYK